MNAIRTSKDREQFRALLRFSDDTSADVFGRMAGDIPTDIDERLRALAGGGLSSNEQNYVLEELVSSPELLRRLAQYLQDKVSPDDL
jgi:hypothetical protein